MSRPRTGLFGPRSPRYPALKAYLLARPRPSLIRSEDWWSMPALGFAAVLGTFTSAVAGSWLLLAAVLVVVAATGRILLMRKASLPTPEEDLARKADAVVRKIEQGSQFSRLHRAFHPAVAATLEECATYHARVAVALEGWAASDLRETARLAAKVAMDEALVRAGETLDHVSPASPLEGISDALEDVGFGPLVRDGRAHEPMPPAFRPVREIAERLRELASRCEAKEVERRDEEAVSPAFRHLDAALGEMRSRQEAESELRQGA